MHRVSCATLLLTVVLCPFVTADDEATKSTEVVTSSSLASSPLFDFVTTPSAAWTNATTETVITSTPSIAQLWEESEARLKKLINDLIRQMLPMVMKNAGEVQLSPKCMGDLLRLVAGIRNLKSWAFNMLDATGKLMDGVLRGSMYSLGSYDQCLNVVARHNRKKEKILFYGQYCNVEVKPPVPMPKPRFYKLDEVLDEFKEFSQRKTVMAELSKYAQFFYFLSYRFGVCIPSTCTREDLEVMLETVATEADLNITVPWCDVKKPQEFSIAQISVIALFSFLAFIVLLATLYHSWKMVYNVATRGVCQRLVLSFSIFHNTSRMFRTKETPGIITCLYGIKFLSITWIILGNTYLNIDFVLFRGIYELKNFAKDAAFQAVLNSNIAVDSFFFVSGLLVCYGTVRSVKVLKEGFSLPYFIFHRILRLAPGHMLAIAGAILATLMVRGPLRREVFDKIHSGCHDNWWTNLLFVNNFVNVDNMCLPHGWYLAADMQMYLFSLVALIPLIMYLPAVGLFANFLVMVGSMVGTGYATYHWNYPPTMLYVHPDPEDRMELWTNMYYLPYPHLGAYCVGIFVGYLLAVKPKLNINPVVQVAGWGFAIACNLAVLYGVYEWNMGRDPTLAETILYSGAHRTAWAIGLAWVTVACSYGCGGIVNDILSWSVLIPLSRMALMVYLVHPIVQVTFFGNSREEIPPSHYIAVWFFFGHLMASYAVAYGSSMLVEYPIASLEKVILGREDPHDDEDESEHQEKPNHYPREKPTDEIEFVGKEKLENGTDGLYIPTSEDTKLGGIDNKGFVCRL